MTGLANCCPPSSVNRHLFFPFTSNLSPPHSSQTARPDRTGPYHRSPSAVAQLPNCPTAQRPNASVSPSIQPSNHLTVHPSGHSAIIHRPAFRPESPHRDPESPGARWPRGLKRRTVAGSSGVLLLTSGPHPSGVAVPSRRPDRPSFLGHRHCHHGEPGLCCRHAEPGPQWLRCSCKTQAEYR
jgi:hypothetical protein